MSARAEVLLTFNVDGIATDEWQIQHLSISAESSSEQTASLQIAADSFTLPSGYGSLQGLTFRCIDIRREAAGWQCDSGELTIATSPVGPQQINWRGRFASADSLSIALDKLRVQQGTLALQLERNANGWSSRVTLYRVPLPTLHDAAQLSLLPREWGTTGLASGTLALTGQGDSVSALNAELLIDGVNLGSPDGRYAAEKMVGKLALTAKQSKQQWSFDGRFDWPSGAFYADPIYLSADEGPLSATVAGSWAPSAHQLRLDGWSVDLVDTATISGTGVLRGEDYAIQDLTVAAQSGDAGRFYDRLIKPFVVGSAVDDMTASGSIGAVLHFNASGLEQAGLQLNQLRLSDRQQRFSIGELSGSIAWDRQDKVPVSRLDAATISLYGIPTGSFSVQARFAGDRIELLQPIVVPLLEGAVALENFTLDGALADADALHWNASATVRQVSLQRLTEQLGWTPFGGIIAGELKNMEYANHAVRLGGGLALKAFDGNIRVSDLSITDPLGLHPVLRSDATLRGLDLTKLTEAFAFGRIDGRLDGDVKNLRLDAWQPSRFDLHLYTPAGDTSRRRISQRAVQNLTELGSGLPSGLYSTVLRAFNDFRYQTIDVKIDLKDDLAHISGLARPDGGYYLVKGAGLPRIDVIGRNRDVAWRDLVSRLQQIQVEGVQFQ